MHYIRFAVNNRKIGYIGKLIPRKLLKLRKDRNNNYLHSRVIVLI